MPSKRKVIANRKNARMSTGPRTPAGKMRSARNAYRHGLSASLLSEPALVSELEQVAAQIAGQSGSARLHELAMAIAAAQIDLVRVRQARRQLFSRTAHANHHGKAAGPHSSAENVAALASVLTEVAQQLAAIDRYERRALSRRKSAIRAFDLYRAADGIF